MDYKIVETSSAVKDMERIVTYIAQSLENPQAATAFLDAVEQCYRYLETTPEMYERCHDPQLRLMGYRKAVIKHYILIYKINESQKTVYILRLFYGKQDYEKLI